MITADEMPCAVVVCAVCRGRVIVFPQPSAEATRTLGSALAPCGMHVATWTLEHAKKHHACDCVMPGTHRVTGIARHGLTTLLAQTYHPTDYVLTNERDGSRWRGTAEGTWKREGE